MIAKTRGIVFRFTKFRETSIIVTIFTEDFGLQSYMVNGVRSKSGKIALYQPLTLLNLVVYHRENANIERIKEVSCYHQFQSLTADVKKSTIAMFLAELLNKTVKLETHAKAIFDFVSTSLVTIDQLGEAFENAHLIFMIQLSRYLGFGAQFVNEILGPRLTDENTELVVKALLHADYNDKIPMTNEQRRNVLDLLIRFYAEHIENLGELKSVQVLREVLS